MMTSIGRKVSAPKARKETQSTALQSDCKDELNWPALFRFLHIKRETAETAKTGSLTIFTIDGRVKLVLNDRPNRKSCFLSGEHFGDVFRKAEEMLAAGTCQWRAKGYQRRSRAKVYS